MFAVCPALLVKPICKLFELANLLLLTSFHTKFACQASQHEYMVNLQNVVGQVFRELLTANAPHNVLVQLNHLLRWILPVSIFALKQIFAAFHQTVQPLSYSMCSL